MKKAIYYIQSSFVLFIFALNTSQLFKVEQKYE